ncbi:penicillin-binding protein 1A [Halomonas garicola]|uniref:penicillin-binding protein 1A n=1 Tax=Halomonas garicola TaxID=1690008 RepID=UPI0028A01183|nr:PBP1A family penicillin-binding protein [Halomonas garicola]
MTLFRTLVLSLIGILVSLAGAVALATIAAALYFAPGLPDVRQLEDFDLHTPLRIYTRDGQLMGEYGEERRIPVDFQDIPEPLINALVAAEDQHYFEHPGVDPRGLVRAAVELARSGGTIQSGGSTITMQVARNYLLTLDQTFTRKFREILLALQMEQVLNKQEILSLYVNKIFLGHRAYGIAAASRTYYDRPMDELTLAESAMIAGLPKAPSAFNPLSNPERSLIRRNWILFRMRELGFIAPDVYQEAVQAPITAQRHVAQAEVEAAYVAEMARQYAIEQFGDKAYTSGYHIYTTIDSELQPLARRTLAQGLLAYDRRHGFRGPEQNDIPASLVEAQEKTATEGLEEELSESPEIRQTAREAAERSQTEVAGIEGDVSNWVQVLQRTPSYGLLEPAIVVESGEREMRVLTDEENVYTLNWEGMKWTGKGSAEQIAKRGDLIRVIIDDEEDTLRLSQRPEAEGALVAQQPRTGAIVALQGGFDFDASKFNRAIQARRQSGSIFKPFIYLPALNDGEMNAASVVNDAPIVIDDGSDSLWRPVNSSRDFNGPMRLRPALARSRNLVTIRILQSMGLGYTINFLERFGFNPDHLPRGLSLALGSASLTPLEMTNAYAILANGGFKVSPWYIKRIERGEEDSATEVYKADPTAACRDCAEGQETVEIDGDSYRIAQRIADKEAVYILRDMLRDVIEHGTGRAALTLERDDIVGKTGSTNALRDAWFAGFNGNIATAVWVGKDSNQTIAEYGSQAALPIWKDFMGGALEGTPEAWPEQPETVVSMRVDPDTGLRMRDDESGGISELFDEEHLPSYQPRRVSRELERVSGSEGSGTAESIF